MNCSDLIPKLSRYSSEICNSSQQQQKDFLAFSQKKSDFITEIEINYDKKQSSKYEVLDKIIVKIVEFQQKKCFVFSTILVCKAFQEMETLGNNEKKSEFAIYNMIKDMKRENFIRISQVLQDFLERNLKNLEINSEFIEKNREFEFLEHIFWAFSLHFYRENTNKTLFFSEILKKTLGEIEKIVNESLSNSRFSAKNVVFLFVNLQKFLSEKRFFGSLKKVLFFEKNSNFIYSKEKNSIFSKNCDFFEKYSEIYEELTKMEPLEKTHSFCLEEFRDISSQILMKLLEKIEKELYDPSTLFFNL